MYKSTRKQAKKFIAAFTTEDEGRAAILNSIYTSLDGQGLDPDGILLRCDGAPCAFKCALCGDGAKTIENCSACYVIMHGSAPQFAVKPANAPEEDPSPNDAVKIASSEVPWMVGKALSKKDISKIVKRMNKKNKIVVPKLPDSMQRLSSYLNICGCDVAVADMVAKEIKQLNKMKKAPAVTDTLNPQMIACALPDVSTHYLRDRKDRIGGIVITKDANESFDHDVFETQVGINFVPLKIRGQKLTPSQQAIADKIRKDCKEKRIYEHQDNPMLDPNARCLASYTTKFELALLDNDSINKYCAIAKHFDIKEADEDAHTKRCNTFSVPVLTNGMEIMFSLTPTNIPALHYLISLFKGDEYTEDVKLCISLTEKTFKLDVMPMDTEIAAGQYLYVDMNTSIENAMDLFNILRYIVSSDKPFVQTVCDDKFLSLKVHPLSTDIKVSHDIVVEEHKYPKVIQYFTQYHSSMLCALDFATLVALEKKDIASNKWTVLKMPFGNCVTINPELDIANTRTIESEHIMGKILLNFEYNDVITSDDIASVITNHKYYIGKHFISIEHCGYYYSMCVNEWMRFQDTTADGSYEFSAIPVYLNGKNIEFAMDDVYKATHFIVLADNNCFKLLPFSDCASK